MRKLLVASAITIALSIGALLLWQSHSSAGGAAAPPVEPDSRTVRADSAPPEQTPSSQGILGVELSNSDALEEDTDALDRAGPLLKRARAGEADAQYELFQLLNGCRDSYERYFSKGVSLLGKEEAAIRADMYRTVDEDAFDIYQLCHRLMQEQPELTTTAAHWLDQALQQGHPKAQIVRASQLLMAMALVNPRAGKTAPPNAERDARSLLESAVASGDPEVIWYFGELRPLLGGAAEDTRKERWALELAACDRGLDCGPNARWVRTYCRADPAHLCPINANAEELIRSRAGSDFEMVKMRAREITALIETGNTHQLFPE
jgi:TPR repeat protein